MPYYAGDPGIEALAKYVPSGLKTLGGKALQLLKTPAGAGAAAGAAGLAAGALAEKALGGGEERRRYRRMNVLNPYALRRSMRRVQGFARFARKTMHFVRTHRLKKSRRR